MSEAIILYRGRGGGVDPESLKPQTVTSNGTYTAPVTGNYWVAVVGGGGGGGGGCRNSWNVSQVFYGAGGTRGTLNAGLVALNQGDQVSMTLGIGGSGGTNNTTVVSNNSRGSNGGTGASSSFGTYRSGSGGTWGGWSWSYHYWSNVNMGWNNVVIGTENVIIGWNNYWYNWTFYSGRCPKCGAYKNGSVPPRYCTYDLTPISSYTSKPMSEYITEPKWGSTDIWSNTIIWNNKITNTTTRCYTSIQQGSWWYTNAANNVSTSGTRTYRGDGGASGRAGNAGFIVIVPPSL